MDSDRINLLPAARLEGLRRQYLYRLATVALLMLTALVIIHGVLLYATHIYLASEVKARTAELASVTVTTTSSESAALDARLAAITKEAALITALPAAPSAASLITAIEAISRSGITLSRFVYQPTGQ